MKRFIIGVLVGLLLVGAVVLAQGEWQGQQWEYVQLIWSKVLNGALATASSQEATAEVTQTIGQLSTEDDPYELMAALDRMGGEGWELVSVVPYENFDTYYFKRPKS